MNTKTTRTEEAETELRVRELEGRWYQDLQDEIYLRKGKARAAIVGAPDTSTNFLERWSSRQNRMTTPAPFITGLTRDMLEAFGDASGEVAIAEYEAAEGLPCPSDLVQTLQEAGQYLWGCNFVGVYVSWDKAAEKACHTPVTPDLLRGWCSASNASCPIGVGYKRKRMVEQTWRDTWDVWDITDPKAPTFRILVDCSWVKGRPPVGGRDITETAAPELFEKYAWMLDGKPFIPVEILHLYKDCFNRTNGSERSDATLTLGIRWTIWGHGCDDASWPQRWTKDVVLFGGIVTEDEGPKGVTTDAASMVMFLDAKDSKPGIIGQWAPAFDPMITAQAIAIYEARIDSQSLGITVAGVGGDPAPLLEAARDAKIVAAYPMYRRAIASLLGKLAAISDLEGGTAFPTSGFGVSLREEVTKLLAPKPAPEPKTPKAPEVPEAEDESTPDADEGATAPE